MAQQAKGIRKIDESGRSKGTEQRTRVEREKKPRAQHRITRWYPKKRDDVIIERWAEACSERHNSCRKCPHTEECQDLVDRLIACMDVRPSGHREVVGKE